MLCLSSIPLRRFRLVVATDVSCGALSAHSLCEPPRVAVEPSTALPSAGERVLRCVAALGLRRTALEIAIMLCAVARAALPGSLFANEVVVACLSSSHDYRCWCVWTRVQNLSDGSRCADMASLDAEGKQVTLAGNGCIVVADACEEEPSSRGTDSSVHIQSPARRTRNRGRAGVASARASHSTTWQRFQWAEACSTIQTSPTPPLFRALQYYHLKGNWTQMIPTLLFYKRTSDFFGAFG